MTNPNSTSAFLLQLSNLRTILSKSEKAVVDYTLQFPEEVIHLSVSALAESSNVSEATVVRACRKMGFNGYQDFKIALAQNTVTPLQSIHEAITDDDSTTAVVDKIFQGTIQTLNLTHDIIKTPSIEKAVQALLNAESIHIFGIGNSNAIANDFQHKLLRLGLHAFAYSDAYLQMIAATYVTEKDVVFSISHSGSSIDITSSSKQAKKNGATVISLTSIGTSPLSKVSDINLFTSSNETKYRMVGISSRIAQMVIIDTIYTLLAVRIPDSSEHFYNIEKALESKRY